MLKDDEIGCYTCAFDRDSDARDKCKSCIRGSNWKGVAQVNKTLRKLGLPTYINATEMRINTLYGTEHAIRYRIRELKKRKNLDSTWQDL